MNLIALFLLLLSESGVCGDMQAWGQLSSRVINPFTPTDYFNSFKINESMTSSLQLLSAGKVNQGVNHSGLQHVPVRYEGKQRQKPCVNCSSNSTRTKAGYYVYTSFYCLACNIPLCRGEPRNCFAKYHNLT